MGGRKRDRKKDIAKKKERVGGRRDNQSLF